MNTEFVNLYSYKNDMTIKSALLQILIDICDKVKNTQNDSGKIMCEKKFNIYSQCTGFYYATLYKYNHTNNIYFNKKEILERALKCWDYYLTLLDEHGKTHIITYDQSWGYDYEEWNTLHLMNTIELLKDDLGESRLLGYRNKVKLSAEGLYKVIKKQFSSKQFNNDLENYSVANHFLWSVTCVYRYAMLINNNVLKQECDNIITKVCKYQLPFGTFLEGGSLVVNYSHTTLGALCLYLYYNGNRNKEVYKSALKNMSYLSNCYYQGTEIIGCFDSRNRDNKNSASPHIPGALFDNKIAVEFASEHVIGFMKNHKKLIEKQQSLGFFTASFYSVPDDIELERKKDIKSEIIYIDKLHEPILAYSKEKLNTLKIQKNGFVIPVCILTHKTNNIRWYLERQNLYSIYHLKWGLILGGGHSHSMPEFSCFNVISNGTMEYLHEQGRFITDKKVQLTYNNIICEIEFMDISDKNVVVRYSTSNLIDTDKIIVNIPIPIKFYENIFINNNNILLSDSYISEKHEANTKINTNKCSILINKQYISKYPIYAFDPYMQKQSPSIDNAFFILSTELDYIDNAAEVIIKLES